jgi:predicted nucleotidyltransferase
MKVVVYNKNLNPDFWTSEKQLKPEVRVALLKIGQTFFKNSGLKVHVRDIIFLGSSANYNWTPTSDCDLHLLIDFNDLKMPFEQAKQYTKSISKKWNEETDISIKNHNVEVYIQDVSEKNEATGIYSLIQNKWIKEAMPQNIILNKTLIQEKYTTWVNRILNSISSNNIDVMKKTMDDLTIMRQTGLSAAGEFSTENLVFKILRQRDVIGKLKNALQKKNNELLSVNEMSNEIDNSYFTGIVDDKLSVKAVRHGKNKAGMSHALFGFGNPSGRWRYIQKYNRVDWSDVPNDEKMDAVDDYLSKYDIHPQKHMSYIGGSIYRKQFADEGFDPTSFGPNPSATVGLSLNSSDGGIDKDFYERNNNLMRKL